MAVHVCGCVCTCVCVFRPTSRCSSSPSGGFVPAWLFHKDQSLSFMADGVKVRFNDISQVGEDFHWVCSLA